MKKEYFKHPLAILFYVVAGLGLLFWGISYIYETGGKDALKKELEAVDAQIGKTSARTNSDVHLKLLARRKRLQDLISKY